MEDFRVRKGTPASDNRASKGSLLNAVRSCFTWIGALVTREAKEVPVEREQQELQKKRLLSRYPLSELLAGGEKSMKSLAQAKEAFLQRAGSAGEAFVARNVDPIFLPLQRFIVSLKAERPDERSLVKEAREGLEKQTRQALLEDIAFVLSYPGELLENAHVSEAQQSKILRDLEKQLKTVLVKFEKLLDKSPVSEDLYDLFTWRVTLDNERQSLHDIAIKFIEEKLSPYRLKFSAAGETVMWMGQSVESLPFKDLHEAIQYTFELVKSSESARSDDALLEFFAECKQRVQTIFEEECVEDDRIRLLHTLQLIEDILGPNEKFT
jgi:hypothetical protein